ncbi:Hermansky-Pudlak syndrome 3 [Phytophthora infestans]|uniref:Hermansky-Pudlak syndrome 3 n=1 Tax=Phytophthora infestans TaxID=4787 RepID=A0A833SNK7_PHYIN|nr:Hermansky-Pudlak syndrome 3 [Phytophthora infestans]
MRTNYPFKMESLFVRSLALGAATDDTQTLASASRTTADATFAVASGREGVIRVYAASCSALLHEFSCIHSRVYTLHYTSFSDSLVTLESDVKGDDDDEDAETFLCVYHDWRERKMVRGYTLPLGVLESPSSNRKADCVAVCSFTGRVVVAMGSVLNIWQCSHGFFEHVMELTVDMAQRHAFLQVEYVAIHGVYVAFASQTEVRVMEIHVRSSNDVEEAPKVDAGLEKTLTIEDHNGKQEDGDGVPPDSSQCVEISSFEDLNAFVEVPVSCSAYSTVEADTRREQDERRIFDEQEQTPMVLGRNEAQQEVWNLAGLDIRTNQAMSYFIGEDDVSVLLQRYLPPNHSVRSLKFLPETIDNRVCVETRSYTRLLVATDKHAFLYYFLSEEVDSTRKKMSKKVLGKGERTKSRGMHKPIKMGKVVVGQSRDSFTSVESEDEEDGEADSSTESGRVVMHYTFTSAVTSITANSSFLFVATLSGLQVWSIWSPCHFMAASRALSKSLVPQPSQPQLLCTQPIPYPVSQLAALDSYVVLLPQVSSLAYRHDIMHMASLAAAERLPEAEFELRPPLDSTEDQSQRSILIFQQSPPSLVFSYVRQGVLSTDGDMKPFQIDLLLSLFSLYRYRADVGSDLLRLASSNGATRKEAAVSISDRKEELALELETKLYDRLAGECAAVLAAVFMSKHHRNLERAALLFVASNVPSIEVMQRLQAIVGIVDRSEVIRATGKYLEAFVFPPPESLADVCAPQQKQKASADDAKFTRIVLLHYGKYFPEQLSRLIVDSSLKWTLEDIAFALEKLEESSSHSVLVKIARLVLVLRGATFPREGWDALDTPDETFTQQCSHPNMVAIVDDLLVNHVDALIHLTVTHPDLLVQEVTIDKGGPGYTRHFSSSKLTKALLEKAPSRYLDILERIFNNAIGRQETIQSTLLFCLTAIGDAAAPSASKIASSGSSSSDDQDTAFVPDQVLVLRFLVFVLQMFPTLEQLSEREEVQDDEEDLQSAKAAVAAELTRLCVKLCSCFHGSQNSDDHGRVEATVCDLFEPIVSQSAPHGTLPGWVQEYLKTRCLPETPRLRRTLEYLFYQALGLLHQKALIRPQDVLSVYQVLDVESSDQMPWKLENDLAALVVLLTLPRVSRTVDGLKLIAQRADFINLFLPYGKSFCVTLDEWRFLISTLSSISENATEAEESAILENILNHVCLTLSPEDLLQVLPDDGDIALYMSTIEVSMRLDQVREKQRDSRLLNAVAG